MDVNKDRRAEWMKKKKLHAGGFLKSPFNMYEGSSMDPGSHKQATRQKGVERRAVVAAAAAATTTCVASRKTQKNKIKEKLFSAPSAAYRDHPASDPPAC